jgi:hypothetical protein
VSAHVDLIADLGPAGVRTEHARNHLVTCLACRRRVAAVGSLVRFAREARSAHLGVNPARARRCPSPEEIVRLASAGRQKSSASLQSHLDSCPECALALEESRRALAAPSRAVRSTAPLPPDLERRIRAMATSLPMAAIPRDITRPSPPRSTQNRTRGRRDLRGKR